MTEHFLKDFLINNNIRGSILLELVFMDTHVFKILFTYPS
jgi:hypothetical protein